jgi:hypothetical protein
MGPNLIFITPKTKEEKLFANAVDHMMTMVTARAMDIYPELKPKAQNPVLVQAMQMSIERMLRDWLVNSRLPRGSA